MEEKTAEIVLREALEVASRKNHLEPVSRKANRPKRRGKRKKSGEEDKAAIWRNLAMSLIVLLASVIITLLVAILALLPK